MIFGKNRLYLTLFAKKHVQHVRLMLIEHRYFKFYKKAVLPQGNRAMPQVFFSVEVRQQHSLQV